MKISSISKALLLGTTVLGLASMAQASLTTSFIWSGNGDWSLDSVGSNSSPVGNVRAFVPVGSTVVQAFLYSSTYSPANPNITLGSTSYSGAAWTALGVNSGFLQAYRADVTAQMISAIGGGSASTFNFSVTENTNNGGTDGEVLAIVFKNAADTFHTIAFQDGFSASGGDATTLTYANPLSGVGSAGFSAEMSLGIGFGYQPSGQFSTVDVNGRRLTSSAGGQDDGGPFNGGLITVGGIGDSAANPTNPFANDSAGPRSDDELYDLGQGNGVNSAAFVANGDTSTLIHTTNPSSDDNIFFLGLNITADATVNNQHHNAPDSGTSVVLLGLGLMGLAAGRRFLSKAKV